MNIQEELHKVFPVPHYDVLKYLDTPAPDKLYVAEAHARFFEHLKNCTGTAIAKHKNMDTNTEIMAAIMANDIQGLISV